MFTKEQKHRLYAAQARLFWKRHSKYMYPWCWLDLEV